MTRGIKFGRFGFAEDPAGYHVTARGKIYFVDSCYRREGPPAALMLRVRHLNGERAPDVAAGSVQVLGGSASFPTNRLKGEQS